MKKRKKTTITAAIAVVLILCAVLASCGLPGQKEPENPKEPEKDGEETITLKVSDLFAVANQSYSLWEYLGRTFPDRVIYKNAAGKFTFSMIDKSLPLNDYDWNDLSNTVKGIDVSSYQGSINWKTVASQDISFAIVRLGYRGYGEGTLVLDKNYKTNVKGAADAGLGVGVYFVTTALNEKEAVEEADFVLKNIKGYDITWPVVLDLEDSGGSEGRAHNLSKADRTAIIIAFCDRIKEAGYTPMLYANVGWYMTKMDLKQLTGYDKWFAQYFNAPQFPYAFQIWQASSTGSLDGIKGNVDIDYSSKIYGYLPQGWN